jgi:hypothetical protein
MGGSRHPTDLNHRLPTTTAREGGDYSNKTGGEQVRPARKRDIKKPRRLAELLNYQLDSLTVGVLKIAPGAAVCEPHAVLENTSRAASPSAIAPALGDLEPLRLTGLDQIRISERLHLFAERNRAAIPEHRPRGRAANLRG